ncbi:ubiquitin-like domain-containing CTD phosphatase-like protein, partial [Trifolium pratense]
STTEEDLIVDPVESPEILDDFELPQEEAVDIKDMQVNKLKLSRRINHFKTPYTCTDKISGKWHNLVESHVSVSANVNVNAIQVEIQNPCRQGKKLLVLDIDYTLFDHRSTAENPLQLMRPYLHEFLTAVYAEYDIMIWSATSMKWINLKMSQLGVLDNPNYKITALLDHLAMITVQTASRGVFDCKPLGLIWAQFPEFYSASNTIMFDDLRRNFVMNPQNGLTIRPFRKAHANRDSDQELVKLTQYLLAIAELDDLSHLDHSKWESFSEDTGKRRRHR